MKKQIVALATIMFLSACYSGPIYRSNTPADYSSYNCTGRCQAKRRAAPQRVQVYEEPKPIVKPCQVAQPKPVVKPCNTCAQAAQPCPNCTAPCNNCAPKVEIVKEPVEIVYKKTTKTTVYEPKTITNVSYEKEQITTQPVETKTVVTTTTTQSSAPVEIISAPAQTETKTETISYTIDSTPAQPTAQVMPEEEIK